MARKKRRKVVSSPWKVGLILIFIGLLYFFVNFYAPSSPLIYIHYLTDFLFWKLWTNFFFWLLIGLWVILILYPANWKERIFLYSFITFALFLWILNFPYLENSNIEITDFWWWIWLLILTVIKFLMWNSIFWIKAFSIILFALAFIFTSWKLNLFLLIPKIEFEIPEEKKKKERKVIKIKTSSKQEKKTEQETIFASKKEEKKSDKKGILKNFFKEKLEKKLEEKKQEQKTIIYPKDKPTFLAKSLQHNTNGYQIDDDILLQQAYDIKKKLEEFNIPVEIAGYEVWPTVIQFKIKPAKWVKVSSIEKLKKDLSLSLKSSIRILAPIPWTEYVWIEMPNPVPSIVYLADVVDTPEFSQKMNKQLTNLAIGKSISWELFIQALEDMPHLLVAGQTGSWKSVAINDFILSLLYQNTPNELKFIMVDPKQVELGFYEWLPYLLAPIINDAEKALKALKWAVEVMERRYRTLKEARVKKISEYNEKVDEKEKMSRIVIIVDELADLMMTWNKKEVEIAISRIAQKARAVWIHLILATQRPSVNVITWLIKANIPTRIAFWVVSSVDSRTILDRGGAEDLLWKWDLLYVSPKYKYPIRVQAPFITTEDTENIIAELKQKYIKELDSENDIYDKELIDILEWNKPEWTYQGNWWNDDELLEQAIEIIQQTQKASITLLQRRLKVWFARAARLMDQLEERWIVGPQEWSKPREILI